MERTNALKTLRLSDSEPSRESVINAYAKMARRYPQRFFPEKHRDLLDARDSLLKKDRAFREVLFGGSVDLSWLQRHLDERPTNKPLKTKIYQDFLRPAIKQDILDSETSFGYRNEIEMAIASLLDD